MKTGKINCYTCPRGHETITRLTRTGVTPMMIPCSVENCPEHAKSSWYKCSQDLTPTAEWYKPSNEEYFKLSPATRDHVRRGGLLLRKIESPDAE